MPNRDDTASHERARSMETDNHMQGRTGAETQKNRGPASRHGVAATNPTAGGGINRSTKSPSGAGE